MFTGIVEEVGIVEKLLISSNSSKIIISAKKVLVDTKIGDSIATNGVCLTVTSIDKNCFTADIMNETFQRTNLKSLKKGDRVNLERALLLTSRLGGHIVTGHIDGKGIIEELIQDMNSVWITIRTDNNILKYIVEKGSITIDGISLTVAYVDNKCFKVSIIPHTKNQTNLIEKKVGSYVNLECDIISKYVEKLMTNSSEKQSKITKSFLEMNGFV